MAEMNLDRALATLNFARSTLNPNHVMIFIYGDDDGNPHMGVGVDHCVEDIELNDFFGFHDAIAETQIAGDYVTLALEAEPALRIVEDHSERWVIIRRT